MSVRRYFSNIVLRNYCAVIVPLLSLIWIDLMHFFFNQRMMPVADIGKQIRSDSQKFNQR